MKEFGEAAEVLLKLTFWALAMAALIKWVFFF